MEENAKTETQTTDTTDYKTLYEQTLARAENAEAEAKKQKDLKDNYAKESADRKKREMESLPEMERIKKENEDYAKNNQELLNKIALMERRNEGVSNGFSAEETEKLINGNFSFKDIAEIIKKRTDEAIKSTKAEYDKSSTSQNVVGSGTAKATQSYAERLAQSNFSNESDLDKIKQLYK